MKQEERSKRQEVKDTSSVAPISIQPEESDSEERKRKFWPPLQKSPGAMRVLRGEPEPKIEDSPETSPATPLVVHPNVVYDVFTPVSPEYFNFPDVVKWCSDRGAVPVSPKECFANRIAQDGLNDTDKMQFTRCAVLYTIVDGKLVALFDDIAVPDENVVLKYFGEGVADHGYGNFVLPRKNSLVKNSIDRAIADNRFLSLEGRTNNYTTHSLTPDSNGCEYSRVLTPVIGSLDVVDGHAILLREHKNKYTSGGIRLLTPEDLRPQNLSDNIVVRLFRVGGIGDFDDDLDDVDADGDFDYNGWACGVAPAQKNSIGNRGVILHLKLQ